MSLLDNMPGLKQQVDTDHGGAVDDDVDFDVNDNHNIPADLLATIKCPGHSHPIINHLQLQSSSSIGRWGQSLCHCAHSLLDACHFILPMAHPSEPFLSTMLLSSLTFLTYDQLLLTFLVAKLLMGRILFTSSGGLGELDPPFHFHSKSSKSDSNFDCRIPTFMTLVSYGLHRP